MLYVHAILSQPTLYNVCIVGLDVASSNTKVYYCEFLVDALCFPL